MWDQKSSGYPADRSTHTWVDVLNELMLEAHCEQDVAVMVQEPGRVGPGSKRDPIPAIFGHFLCLNSGN